jgi:hypothetical protein
MTQVANMMMAAVAVLIWAVVIWRHWALRAGGTGQVLWWALALLAVGQTLQVLPLYQGVDRTVQAATGYVGAAAALKHTAALLSAACVRALVSGLAGTPLPAVRRVGLPAAALLAMAVPYLLWPPTQMPQGLADRAEFYGPALGVTLPWAAFLAYLSWALGSAALLCWRHRRYAASRALRRGLEMVAAGATAGFAYVALKIVMQATWATGDGSALVALDAAGEAVILGVSVTLCTLGSTSEALADRLAAARDTLRAARSLRRLHPLWRVLVATAPAVTLLPDSGSAARLDPRTTHLRLVRRVVEIRDALLQLEPYLPDQARSAAAEQARAMGLSATAAPAVAEAAVLHLALVAHAAGVLPAGRRQPPPGGSTLREETAWLEQIASAWAGPHAPLIAREIRPAIRSGTEPRAAAARQRTTAQRMQ